MPEEESMLDRRRVVRVPVSVLWSLWAVVVLGTAAAQSQESSSPTVQAGPYTALDGFHSPFAQVAQVVGPAVVYIEVRKDGEAPSAGPYGGFFEDFIPRGHGAQPPSAGSGFVMDDQGHVMTNNHVIDGAQEVYATFLNGERYLCEIVGQDPRTDIAVLRVAEASRTGGPFPNLILGDSDEIFIGDWAIAVGSPFGAQLAGSVTVGVISAKGRSNLNIMGADIDLQDFIQTDASINFGNSGGPLVNIRGEVIGVNTALNTQGQGIGFAVPVNLAASVAYDLIRYGRVRRGYLGVRPVQLTREIAEGKDWDVHQGILITLVEEGSPAEQSGLRENDVLLEFDNRPVSRVSQFRILVAGTPIGKEVGMKVYRDGEYLDLKVKLGEFEEPVVVAEVPATLHWLGMVVEDAGSPSVQGRFDLGANPQGVVITEVEEGGPAAEKGLEAGSQILEIVNQEIRNLDDYERLRQDLRDRTKPITLKIKEGGMVRYVVVQPRG
jgi:serine protease Do